eukprot:Lankesteria_metandrocarpae@DN5266_c0_g1_i1.p2
MASSPLTINVLRIVLLVTESSAAAWRIEDTCQPPGKPRVVPRRKRDRGDFCWVVVSLCLRNPQKYLPLSTRPSRSTGSSIPMETGNSMECKQHDVSWCAIVLRNTFVHPGIVARRSGQSHNAKVA